MSTLTKCISKDIKNKKGNDLNILLIADKLALEKKILSFGDPDIIEYLYTFEDNSSLRVTVCDYHRLNFVAAGG